MLHHNPFNNLLQHKISTSLHIELFIDRVLVCLQEIYIPHYHTNKCNYGFLVANMFPQRIQFGYQNPISPINDLTNLAFDLCDFPLVPTIDSAQGNLIAHESCKWQFNSWIFFFFLLLTRFATIWAKSINIIRGSRFWLELVAFEGSMGTWSEKKKLCLKFLGIARGVCHDNKHKTLMFDSTRQT